MGKNKLFDLCMDARKLSYSPYSKFAVGAVVLTKDGRTFVGTNIENSSYGLTMCAERNALYNAYMNGIKKDDIDSLSLVADTDKPCSPCGACRQVISELMNKESKIFMFNLKGEMKETTVEEILPYAFSDEDLK